MISKDFIDDPKQQNHRSKRDQEQAAKILIDRQKVLAKMKETTRLLCENVTNLQVDSPKAQSFQDEYIKNANQIVQIQKQRRQQYELNKDQYNGSILGMFQNIMPKRIYPREEFEKTSSANARAYASSHNKIYGNLKPIRVRNDRHQSKFNNNNDDQQRHHNSRQRQDLTPEYSKLQPLDTYQNHTQILQQNSTELKFNQDLDSQSRNLEPNKQSERFSKQFKTHEQIKPENEQIQVTQQPNKNISPYNQKIRPIRKREKSFQNESKTSGQKYVLSIRRDSQNSKDQLNHSQLIANKSIEQHINVGQYLHESRKASMEKLRQYDEDYKSDEDELKQMRLSVEKLKDQVTKKLNVLNLKAPADWREVIINYKIKRQLINRDRSIEEHKKEEAYNNESIGSYENKKLLNKTNYMNFRQNLHRNSLSNRQKYNNNLEDLMSRLQAHKEHLLSSQQSADRSAIDPMSRTFTAALKIRKSSLGEQQSLIKMAALNESQNINLIQDTQLQSQSPHFQQMRNQFRMKTSQDSRNPTNLNKMFNSESRGMNEKASFLGQQKNIERPVTNQLSSKAPMEKYSSLIFQNQQQINNDMNQTNSIKFMVNSNKVQDNQSKQSFDLTQKQQLIKLLQNEHKNLKIEQNDDERRNYMVTRMPWSPYCGSCNEKSDSLLMNKNFEKVLDPKTAKPLLLIKKQ
ncbi:UNKNOWN [Stylonychia lemnae]|uniref:Uncharacterized protein n=1 Tax=Stylonychia lemnae TaxID=5949 RepID=A0A078AIX7_STYLE|nr:UNKNOWN [Stylonychia lemnae]|eukprot:CDW82275.1 UNKNOWN [Stylonychia lemnae]